MTDARMTPAARTASLLKIALHLAAADGLHSLTHARIASAAGVTNGTVVGRLGTMDQVRRSVMRAAVRERCVPVVAEGLARRDRYATAACPALRELAAAWVRQ